MKKNPENRAFTFSAGVCAGIADAIGVDPFIVRILFVLGSMSTGFIPGLVVYVVAALIMK